MVESEKIITDYIKHAGNSPFIVYHLSLSPRVSSTWTHHHTLWAWLPWPSTFVQCFPIANSMPPGKKPPSPHSVISSKKNYTFRVGPCLSYWGFFSNLQFLMCENIKSAMVVADSKVRLRDKNEDLLDLFPDALQEVCEAYHCLKSSKGKGLHNHMRGRILECAF